MHVFAFRVYKLFSFYDSIFALLALFCCSWSLEMGAGGEGRIASLFVNLYRLDT
jgi:hypothetical protein